MKKIVMALICLASFELTARYRSPIRFVPVTNFTATGKAWTDAWNFYSTATYIPGQNMPKRAFSLEKPQSIDISIASKAFKQATEQFKLDPVACAYIAKYISFGDATTKAYVFKSADQANTNTTITPVVDAQPVKIEFIQQQLKIESQETVPTKTTPILPVTPAQPVTTAPTALQNAQAKIMSMLEPLVFYPATNVFIPAQSTKNININTIANNLNTYIQNSLYTKHTNTYALLWGTTNTPTTITFTLPTTDGSTTPLTLPEIMSYLSSTNQLVQIICQSFTLDQQKQVATSVDQDNSGNSMTVQTLISQLETTTAQGTADANFALTNTFLVWNTARPTAAPTAMEYSDILSILYITQFNISCQQEQITFPTASNLLINSTDGQIDDNQAALLDHVLTGLVDLETPKMLLYNGKTIPVKEAQKLLEPYIQNAEQQAPPAVNNSDDDQDDQQQVANSTAAGA